MGRNGREEGRKILLTKGHRHRESIKFVMTFACFSFLFLSSFRFLFFPPHASALSLSLSWRVASQERRSWKKESDCWHKKKENCSSPKVKLALNEEQAKAKARRTDFAARPPLHLAHSSTAVQQQPPSKLLPHAAISSCRSRKTKGRMAGKRTQRRHQSLAKCITSGCCKWRGVGGRHSSNSGGRRRLSHHRRRLPTKRQLTQQLSAIAIGSCGSNTATLHNRQQQQQQRRLSSYFPP